VRRLGGGGGGGVEEVRMFIKTRTRRPRNVFGKGGGVLTFQLRKGAKGFDPFGVWS